MAEFTKEDNVEIQILRAIQEVLKFTDPNNVKASIILDRIRTILRLKDLAVVKDMYEGLTQIYEDYGFAFIKDILAKAKGKD